MPVISYLPPNEIYQIEGEISYANYAGLSAVKSGTTQYDREARQQYICDIYVRRYATELYVDHLLRKRVESILACIRGKRDEAF